MNHIYHNMNRAELDAAYNNTKADKDFSATLSRFQTQSAAFYKTAVCKKNLAYGAGPRQRFDWFPAAGLGTAPTFIFIHGGYWQNCTKEDYSFIARGPLAHGFNVVLAEYTLAPEATMTEIVAEIGMLLDHLVADPDQLGITGGPICLSGHSAGGHLTAMYRSHPSISFAMPISALTDLEPISLCWLNDKLQLTEREIIELSPLHNIQGGAPMTIAFGADELPELIRQSKEYARACIDAGENVTICPLPDCNHFVILDDLSNPDGLLMRSLVHSFSEYVGYTHF
ncbi:alpha/beta hydrolase [Aeromonas sp. MdU4]|uniref:alpha/beta hydrolase n=1 Tax=Aeromonas sp. MdU4 TaxID=3342819 RepID=UPI0035BB7A88